MAKKVLIDELVSPLITEQLKKLNAELDVTIGKINSIKGIKMIEAKTINEAAKVTNDLARETEKLNLLQTEGGKITLQQKQAKQELRKVKELEAKATNDEINAYDRLQAKVYLLEKRARNLAISKGLEAKETQQAFTEHNKYEQQLRKTDEAMNNNRRNVGNYEAATVGLRQQIRQLMVTLGQMELQGKNNTTEYKTMVMQLGKLKDAMGDVSARSKFFADDQRYITGVMGAMRGLIGAYSAYSAVVGMVAGEDEELQRQMAKMMQLMVAMNGIQEVATMLNKDSAVKVMAMVVVDKIRALFVKKTTVAITEQTVATAASTTATQVDTAATEANTVAKTASKGVIGLIIAAIIALGVATYKYIQYAKGATTATDDFNASMNATKGVINQNTQNIGEKIAALQAYIKGLRQTGKSEAEKAAEEIVSINTSFTKTQDAMRHSVADMNKEIEAQRDLIKKQVAEGNEAASRYGGGGADVLRIAEIKRSENLIKSLQTEIQYTEKKIKTSEKLQRLTVNTLTTQLAAAEAWAKAHTKSTETVVANVEEVTDKVREMMKGIAEMQRLGTEGTVQDSPAYNKRLVEWAADIERINILLAETQKDVKPIVDGLTGEQKFIWENLRDSLQEAMPEIREWAGYIQSFIGAIFDAKSVQNENALIAVNKQAEEELAILEKKYKDGLILEADYLAQKEGLTEEAERKRLVLAKQRFEQDKKEKMIQMGIDQIMAQMNIYATVTPWYAAVAQSVAMGIIFAALFENVRKSQFPGYEKGRKGGKGEFAWVGEKGYEYISTDTGIFKTPNTKTFTYLPENASVLPHNVSKELNSYIQMPTVNSIQKVENNSSNKEMLGYLRQIAGKQTAQVSIDKNGISVLTEKAGLRTKFLNSNVIIN